MNFAHLGLAGLLLLAGMQPALAQSQDQAEPQSAPQAAPSPFLGRWALDLGTMPVTYGTPPQSVIYAFSDIGGGRWETTIDITMADGDNRHIAVQYQRDGGAYKSEGDKLEGDTAAIGSPGPNVLVMSLSRDKNLESVRVYMVSADGQTMTESAADVDDEGVPFVRNFTFHRITD